MKYVNETDNIFQRTGLMISHKSDLSSQLFFFSNLAEAEAYHVGFEKQNNAFLR